jgi:hypothetical protein
VDPIVFELNGIWCAGTAEAPGSSTDWSKVFDCDSPQRADATPPQAAWSPDASQHHAGPPVESSWWWLVLLGITCLGLHISAATLHLSYWAKFWVSSGGTLFSATLLQADAACELGHQVETQRVAPANATSTASVEDGEITYRFLMAAVNASCLIFAICGPQWLVS